MVVFVYVNGDKFVMKFFFIMKYVLLKIEVSCMIIKIIVLDVLFVFVIYLMLRLKLVVKRIFVSKISKIILRWLF